ncbi:MAG: hypothetical protein EBZ60_04110 [Betaproteobacteria bacterium]|nr:hypothetical protein [Betaproteobacteria bacterium]
MHSPNSLANEAMMKVICQLNDWENQHLTLTHSLAGRYLYLSIAKQMHSKPDSASPLLKGIYCNKDLSERALRYKLREFEKQGLIAFEPSSTDKRSKRILPSDSLVQAMTAHADALQHLLGNAFLIYPETQA